MRPLTSLGGLHSWTLFLAIVTLWARATPAKPACNPREPCKVGFVGLEFCSCPNGHKCPSNRENIFKYENINYHFCEPPTFHPCAEGEVAWVRRGLRQTVYCTCPAPLRLTSEVWDTKTDTTQYKCSQPRVCRTPDDICMVRNRVFLGSRVVSLLKDLCQCPESQQCKETGHTVKSRAVELQQDIFKCIGSDVDRDQDEYVEENEDSANAILEHRRN